MKRCPFCAEKIQSSAVVCRYCDKEVPATRNSGVVAVLGVVASLVFTFGGCLVCLGGSDTATTAGQAAKVREPPPPVHELLAQARASLDAGDAAKAERQARRALGSGPEPQQAAMAREILAKAKPERERQERERKVRAEKLVAILDSERDDIHGVTWYTAKGAPRYLSSRSEVALYFGVADGQRPSGLRLKIQYVAEDWLFIDHYLIKADDQSFQIRGGYGAVERDHGGGKIWEWYDKPASAADLAMVRAVIESRKAVIRYEGRQYYRDRTISFEVKVRLKQVLDAHQAIADS